MTTRPLRPFDRRLLERTAAARWTLLVNVAAGLAATLLLLAQMTLLAAVIAGAAESRLRQVPATVLVAVVAIVAARAGLAQVVELSGRRTATRVMSALRAELVERRLRRGAGVAGGDSAELAAGAVQGVDGLETYFGRYLPQVVLAVVVPVAVLCWSAAVDLPVSYHWSVGAALDAGATPEEILGILVAVAPISGIARVVLATPEVALSIGYDLDAAFEELDQDPA